MPSSYESELSDCKAQLRATTDKRQQKKLRERIDFLTWMIAKTPAKTPLSTIPVYSQIVPDDEH